MTSKPLDASKLSEKFGTKGYFGGVEQDLVLKFHKWSSNDPKR